MGTRGYILVGARLRLRVLVASAMISQGCFDLGEVPMQGRRNGKLQWVAQARGDSAPARYGMGTEAVTSAGTGD